MTRRGRLVDCIVSTGGGIEEDFIKCLGPTKIGAGCGAAPTAPLICDR